MLSLLARCEFDLAISVRLCIVRVSVGVPSFGRTFFMIGGKVVRSCGYVEVGYAFSLDYR